MKFRVLTEEEALAVSQMFKELFSTTNKQINKDRGIAGMIN